MSIGGVFGAVQDELTESEFLGQEMELEDDNTAELIVGMALGSLCFCSVTLAMGIIALKTNRP